VVEVGVTGQLADTPIRGLPTRGLDDSRTGHIVDWSTRGLDNSRTGQVADWTTHGCHRRLCVLSFPVWRHLRDRELSSPRLVQSVSWLVRELSSPRVDQSARCPVRELAIRELAYPRVVQLPTKMIHSTGWMGYLDRSYGSVYVDFWVPCGYSSSIEVSIRIKSKQDDRQAAACPQCCGPNCLRHSQVR